MILSTCDRLALVVAERHSGYVCVTASVDSINFIAPARENDTLIFSAAINRSWTSSMEIGLRVVSENSYTGTTVHILSAYYTMVALDANSKPIAVPPLTPESEIERLRFEAAQIRREDRLATRLRLESKHQAK